MADLRRIVLAQSALAAAVLCAGAQVKPEAVSQEKFFGKWTLNLDESVVKHAADIVNIEWRSYAADDKGVKVAWGKGIEQIGSYTARCDGSKESAGEGKIRCKGTDASTVDGEQLNVKAHRYYRRTISPDGKTLTITWYSDAARTRQVDKFVYTKAE
jgi:hypothetical protein